MQRLRRTVRCIREVRMRRTQITCEFVQRVMADEDAGLYVQDTVIGVEFLDCRATASGISLAENLLEVSVQQFLSDIGFFRESRTGS